MRVYIASSLVCGEMKLPRKNHKITYLHYLQIRNILSQNKNRKRLKHYKVVGETEYSRHPRDGRLIGDPEYTTKRDHKNKLNSNPGLVSLLDSLSVRALLQSSFWTIRGVS